MSATYTNMSTSSSNSEGGGLAASPTGGGAGAQAAQVHQVYVIRYVQKISPIGPLSLIFQVDLAPLSQACVKALVDKTYEKRKYAALEIEK